MFNEIETYSCWFKIYYYILLSLLGISGRSGRRARLGCALVPRPDKWRKWPWIRQCQRKGCCSERKNKDTHTTWLNFDLVLELFVFLLFSLSLYAYWFQAINAFRFQTTLATLNRLAISSLIISTNRTWKEEPTFYFSSITEHRSGFKDDREYLIEL